MATHNETGKKGEDLAAGWLRQNGFTILHRNWRFSHVEIDIIAQRSNCLHFVEVKTGRNSRYGRPEERVHQKKWQRLQACAQAYLEQQAWNGAICYDILAVELVTGRPAAFYFMEDCFRWE